MDLCGNRFAPKIHATVGTAHAWFCIALSENFRSNIEVLCVKHVFDLENIFVVLFLET